MWFRNITQFRLAATFDLDAASLTERLAQHRFRPCMSQELLSDGWVPPLGRKTTDLVHAVGGCLLVCLQIEEKILPSSVIKEMLGEKVAEIEEQQARNVGRRERERLRDDLMLELLPRAFTRSRRTFAYIDLQEQRLIIDSASAKGVEEVTEQLRETLGSLPITPPRMASAPAAIMTHWLAQGGLPQGVELADECELRDGEGVVRCKGQELQGDEIQAHLKAGKQVTRLALTWQDRLSILLSDDLIVRRLRFLDLIQEKLSEVETETEAQVLDAQFTLMIGELRGLLPQMLQWFGGETQDDQILTEVSAPETAVKEQGV